MIVAQSLLNKLLPERLISYQLELPNACPHFHQKFYVINSHRKTWLLYQPFPEGDKIYKIAINRYGVRSNKNDFAVMNEVKGTPLMDKFAETTHTYGDYIINVMEKVKAGSSNEPSATEAVKLGNEINSELEKMGIGFKIHDIKSDAFGKKGNKFVLLDYGYLHRTSFNSQKTNKDNNEK